MAGSTWEVTMVEHLDLWVMGMPPTQSESWQAVARVLVKVAESSISRPSVG
jgi:hypothetical protein